MDLSHFKVSYQIVLHVQMFEKCFEIIIRSHLYPSEKNKILITLEFP